MIPGLSLHNLAVWVAQVFMITSIGALLPFLFRIRHPRFNLMYYRLLLAGALLLPLMQPIQQEVVVVSDTAPISTMPAPASIQEATGNSSMRWDWRDVILGLLAAGFLLRAGWLAGGLWQLRRFKNSSTALDPIPQPVQRARAITKTDAVFCISETIKGPVTFGFWRPVILLPAPFLDMPEEGQLSVACHELLHVRRKDWLLTVMEELIASLMWFQPAVWWLVAESRLAREQLVDAAVVSLTASRESYIQTLFSLANARWEVDLSVASLFLRRRHLVQRVHSLLAEVSMSKIRLLSCYSSMVAILAVAGWLLSVSFPLIGHSEIRRAVVQEPARPVQNPPGYVVNRSPISYPAEAQQKRIEGTVVVELTFNARGEIVDTRVLSGPEELRQVGLQTAVQGKYPIDIARTLQVVVDFKLPAAGGRRGGPPQPRASNAPAGTGMLAQLSGSVVDPSRNLVPGVIITAKNNEDTSGNVTFIITDQKGEYRFPALPPGTYTLSAQMPGFQTQTYNTVPLGRSQQVRLNFSIQPVSGFSPAPQNPDTPARVRVGRNVMAANLIHQVPPEYPSQTKDAGIQGEVVLEADINRNGEIEALRVVSGHPLLIRAAIDAVKQWVYRPVLLNGQPVDVVTAITVNIP